ncbi:unnamed protein product [Closterium sp. NIES-54]
MDAEERTRLSPTWASSHIRHIKPFQRKPEKGPKAWAALKGVHAPATAPVAVVLERQMAALRIEEDEAVEEGVQKFFDLLTRLEGADLNYSELQKKTNLLALLPESWSLLIINLNRDLPRLSLEDVKRAILQEDFRRRELASADGAGAASIGRGYGRGRGRGRGGGRFGGSNFNGGRGSGGYGSENKSYGCGRGRFDGECHYCHKSGHMWRDCFKLLLKDKRNGDNESDSRDDHFPGQFFIVSTQAPTAPEKDESFEEPATVGKVTLHSLNYLVIDSGATYSMTSRADLLTTLVPSPVKHVTSALGQRGVVKGMGKAMFKGADGKMVGLKNKFNLGGTSKLGEHEESGAAAQKEHKGEESPKAAAEEEYGESMWGTIASAAFSNPTSATGECDWLTLHRRMGHVALPILQQLFTRYPFSSSEATAKAPLDEVVMDVVGPLKLGAVGAEYFLTIVDVYTCMTWVYVLSKKSDVAETVKTNWLPMVERQQDRLDCKFMENLMYKDWKAENEAKIGMRFGEVKSSGLEHVELPLELSSGSTTTRQSSLVNGGEEAKDAEEEEEEVQQVSERAPTLLSRTTSAPRIRVTPQQRHESLHVPGAKEEGRGKRRIQAPNRLTYDALGKPAKSALAGAALMVGDDKESDYEECAFAFFAPIEMPGEPANPKEVLESSGAEEWKKSMESELKSIEENGTWELVELPEGRKAIMSKWLFKIKSDADGKIERYKSRLVAKGYQQKEKVDYKDLFAPVVKPTMLRTLLAGATIKGWVVKQMDMTTAFLNGILEEEIFLAQPEGQWYLKLRGVLEEIGFTTSTADHSLFMLGKREQRSFMVVYVDEILIFSPSSDLVKEVMLKLQDKFKCKALGDVSFYLGLHVERDVEKQCMWVHQRKYLEALAANFGQSECHVATLFPSGFKCVKGPEEESVGEEERRRFHSLVGSLMYAAVNSRPDVAFSTGQLARVVQCPNEEQVAAGMRVAKYLGQTPTVGLQYSAAAQRRQKGTDGFEPGCLFLTEFSDASFASEPEDMTSVGGFICCVGGGPTAWECKKQVDQALSLVESEYMSLFRAVQEIVWQRRLLAELGEEQQGPIPLYCDSQGAIALAKNPVLHGLTEHMRVKWHWTRSMVVTGEVELRYVKTTGQPSDMMTKRLVELQHWKCYSSEEIFKLESILHPVVLRVVDLHHVILQAATHARCPSKALGHFDLWQSGVSHGLTSDLRAMMLQQGEPPGLPQQLSVRDTAFLASFIQRRLNGFAHFREWPSGHALPRVKAPARQVAHTMPSMRCCIGLSWVPGSGSSCLGARSVSYCFSCSPSRSCHRWCFRRSLVASTRSQLHAPSLTRLVVRFPSSYV